MKIKTRACVRVLQNCGARNCQLSPTEATAARTPGLYTALATTSVTKASICMTRAYRKIPASTTATAGSCGRWPTWTAVLTVSLNFSVEYRVS